MLLDDLVTAIQTVQQRIREHGNSLSQNEYRTRLALIDPILNALEWDVSAGPSIVLVASAIFAASLLIPTRGHSGRKE